MIEEEIELNIQKYENIENELFFFLIFICYLNIY